MAAELRASLPQADDVPPHLAGVPRCLHKYEPLFRPEVEAMRASAAPAAATPERV